MATTLYAIALVAYLLLLLGARVARLAPLFARPTLGLFGMVMHACALTVGLMTATGGRISDPLSALSLGMVAGWAWASRRDRMRLVGDLLLGLNVVLLTVVVFVPEPAVNAGAPGVLVWVHLGLILAGFVGFALSFSASALYLLVRRRLKAKRLRELGRLPALENLDRLNARAMNGGFVALSAGIVIAVVHSVAVGDLASRLDMTVGVTLLVWVWYAAGLSVRVMAGWSGRLSALFGVVGFGSVSALMALAVLIQGGWHGTGV
jgi:ABC-type uncharacterized transport system permease subunit